MPSRLHIMSGLAILVVFAVFLITQVNPHAEGVLQSFVVIFLAVWTGTLSILSKKKRHIATIVGMLIFVGYVSSYISLAGCRQDVAEHLTRMLLADDVIYVHDTENMELFQTVLCSLPKNIKVISYGDSQFPQVTVSRPDCYFPFLSSVDYHWTKADGFGSAHRVTYLCFIGMRITISDEAYRAN